MLPVTTLELDAAFKAAILAIVPTFEPLRDARWAFSDILPWRGRQPAMFGAQTRTFALVFSRGEPSYTWQGGIGTAYRFRLAVAAAYTAVDPQLLQHMLTADGVDIRRALSQLRDPTVPGLVGVEDRGLQNDDVDSEGNVVVEHAFAIEYHQSTDE